MKTLRLYWYIAYLFVWVFFFVLHTEMSRVLKTPVQDSPCSLTVSGSYLIFTFSVLGLIS